MPPTQMCRIVHLEGDGHDVRSAVVVDGRQSRYRLRSEVRDFLVGERQRSALVDQAVPLAWRRHAVDADRPD